MRPAFLPLIATSALLALTACGSDDPAASGSDAATDPAAASSTTPTGASGGNGQLFTTQFESGQATLRRYPVAADGSVGSAVTILKAPGSDTTFPTVIDSLSGTVLTGSFTDYWSTYLQRRDLDGTELSAQAVDRWCGGEGAAYNVCVLRDSEHIARTTDLGDGVGEGSVIVSSLLDGTKTAEYGPFTGLTHLLGTTTANLALLTTATPLGQDGDTGDTGKPGSVVALDLSTGETTEVAQTPADWGPLCAVGDDGALGITMSSSLQLVGVGSAKVGSGVKLKDDDSPVGCSADGAYLYIQNIPTLPSEENDDQETASSASALERISVATGARDTVATMPANEWVGPISR